MAVGQPAFLKLTNRYREQARSHRGPGAYRAVRYNCAANRAPWLIARLASSSAATSAPPMR
ncbi:hypothetical protein BSG18_47180 [Pseudomonas ogarae]|nr:hypothetical protein BSG18_47180 [Pseudomonas ogarae]